MESLSASELRRCLRDLLALAMLPAAWARADERQIITSLADALMHALTPDLVYVLVRHRPEDLLEIRAAKDLVPEALHLAEVLAPFLADEASATFRAEILGRSMNVLVVPIDLHGEDGGVVAASRRPSFPGEIDRALLRVAVNQASVALRNARYVAELREAARARDAALATLAAASQRKDDFLAMLGHELRNPLAAIGAAHAQTLASADPGRAQEIIGHQLATLTRLVDDLLDVSRVATGKLTLDRHRVDLRKIVEGARAACEHAAARKSQTLVANVSDVPLWVDGDAVRLEQVLVNVVGNAVRYTPEGGHVSVTVSSSDGVAIVRVEDDGAGISPELLPRIFEPFVQADTSLHRAEGGLGLGLALVKGLVDLHGGDVSITSGGDSKGCSVLLRLPLVDGTAGAAEAAGAPLPPASTSGRQKRPLRVLLVDDNADMTEMLAALLEASGYETARAGDGLEAVDVATRFSPDVAFIDIGLPKLDGYEVVRRLRERLDSRVILVAMSGYGQAEDRARSTVAGFDHHLVKPVANERIEQLLEAVARSCTA
jgi:signal transduction histidine kinase/ActR/RegA family two-component response regulator